MKMGHKINEVCIIQCHAVLSPDIDTRLLHALVGALCLIRAYKFLC